MKKQYQLAVYIGRFQPFHNAHKAIIENALKIADEVLILVGSANRPITYKNPFSFERRESFIEKEFDVIIEPLDDYMYDDLKWSTQVQTKVNFYCEDDRNICLIGHEKDDSSFYLKMFPQWKFIETGKYEQLSATDIRSLYFKEDVNMNFLKNVLPEFVFNYLKNEIGSNFFNKIIKEIEFIKKYKMMFVNAPFPPTFIAADAVVIQSAHILLIERKTEPGKGLYALPGGFLDTINDKSILDCAFRELKEETKIDCPEKILRGNIKEIKIFDAIERSERGRMITQAVYINLPNGPLPKVKGSDDAAKAFWLPISQLDSKLLFNDHFDIIIYFINSNI